ncbi:MAG: OprO/OprP family phosphate-selective porin [Myxococcota bacterium]|nr:OprO/OprP family phosphate-selective porin [Myxococcota bacterium]MDW8363069.1 hypothetical protein [Myxococcales bacterium]
MRDADGRVAATAARDGRTDVVEPDRAFELSGYIQPELRVAAAGDGQVWFQVRRARLKVSARLALADVVVQLDAPEAGVTVRDAYAVLRPPLEGFHLAVFAGLFKVPFGYEVLQSTGDRWFPERSVLGATLFPGERDVGVRVDLGLLERRLRLQLAAHNGFTLDDAARPARRPFELDTSKDVTARLTVTAGPLTAGASGTWGRSTRPAFDHDADPMTPDVSFDYGRFAIGGELRLRHAVPSLGELDAYGELAYARNLARRALDQLPVRADEALDVLAGYVAVTQRLGRWVGAGARLGYLSRERPAAAGTDERIVLCMLLAAFPAEAVRLVAAFDWHLEDADDVAERHEGWLRLQVSY